MAEPRYVRDPNEAPDWLRAAPPEFMPRIAHLMGVVVEVHATQDLDRQRELSRALAEVGEVLDPIGTARYYRDLFVVHFDDVMEESPAAAADGWETLLDDDARQRVIDAMADDVSGDPREGA